MEFNSAFKGLTSRSTKAFSKSIHVFTACVWSLREKYSDGSISAKTQCKLIDTTLVLTYFLTPWSRVLLKKLSCSQLVKEFPALSGTREFITAFTIARRLFLSSARSIQSLPPHPTSWRFILILSSHLHLGLLSTTLIHVSILELLSSFRALPYAPSLIRT